MNNPRKLNNRHKRFLSNQGYDPKDFLIVGEGYDYYTFYSKVIKKIFDIRR